MENMTFLYIAALFGIIVCGVVIVMVMVHVGRSRDPKRKIDKKWDKFI
jgi:hypothetical protein